MSEARVVDLPEPVGPVTKQSPARLRTPERRERIVSGWIPRLSSSGIVSLRIRQVMPRPGALRWVWMRSRPEISPFGPYWMPLQAKSSTQVFLKRSSASATWLRSPASSPNPWESSSLLFRSAT